MRALFALALAGCSSAGGFIPRSDAGAAFDLAGVDLAGRDLAGIDLASSPGDAAAADLASAPDLAGPETRACYHDCAVPADCVLAGAIYDASHWSCPAGACRWLGCNSDNECAATFNAPYVCRPTGFGISSCYQACAAPADCAIGGSQLYDATHWSCPAGACQYLGCNSDNECTAALNAPYVCRPTGFGVSSCYQACAVPADCAVGGSQLFDVTHWTCPAGACQYLGCFGDAECAAAENGPYICR